MFMHKIAVGNTPLVAPFGGFRAAGIAASVTRSFGAYGRGRVHTAG